MSRHATVTRRRPRTLSTRRNRHHRRSARRQSGPGWNRGPLLLLAIPLIAAAAQLSSAPGPSITAAPPSPDPTAQPHRPRNISPRAVREGRDYSFQTGPQGDPVHWPCTTGIAVGFQGATPAGADDALQLVVGRLRDASGLPLQADGPLPASGAITIRYVPAGQRTFGMILTGDIVGKAQTSYTNDSSITDGHVIILDTLDPTTGVGQQVLMHEIGHALGLGHSAPGRPEVMVPSSTSEASPTLGPGDLYALKTIGCTANN